MGSGHGKGEAGSRRRATRSMGREQAGCRTSKLRRRAGPRRTSFSTDSVVTLSLANAASPALYCAARRDPRRQCSKCSSICAPPPPPPPLSAGTRAVTSGRHPDTKEWSSSRESSPRTRRMLCGGGGSAGGGADAGAARGGGGRGCGGRG